MTPSRSAPSGRGAYNQRAREPRRGKATVGGVSAVVRARDVSDGHRRLFTHHQAPISGAGGLAARRATDDCHSPVVLTRQRRAGLTHTYDAATSATISAPGRSDNELPPTDRQTDSISSHLSGSGGNCHAPPPLGIRAFRLAHFVGRSNLRLRRTLLQSTRLSR